MGVKYKVSSFLMEKKFELKIPVLLRKITVSTVGCRYGGIKKAKFKIMD